MTDQPESVSENVWGWLRAALYVLLGMLWAEHKGYAPISLAAFLYGFAILIIITLSEMAWITLRVWLQWRKDHP